MKIIFANFMFFVSLCICQAQIDIQPSCLLLEGDNVEQILLEIDIFNNGDEEVNLYWKFEPAADFPVDWKFQITDWNLNYSWNTSQSHPSASLGNRIEPEEKIRFYLKIQSSQNDEQFIYTITGSSYGTLILFENNEFVDVVASSSCVVSNDNIEFEDLVIYPNPTTDIFQLNNDAAISSIKIYDIIGRQISTLNHNGGRVHNISMLREGMYLLRLIDQVGEVVKTIRLNKW